MGYAIDWSDLEQRIQDQKAALLDTSQNMDPERLKFLVETYDECKGESVFITRAKLFEKVLNNKKIYLDGNPIVGSLAGGRAMIYAYPEWQCNWVKDDLDSEKLALSSLGEVRFSDETKEILKKVYKTWKGKTTYDRANKLYKELYGGNAELLVKCGWIYPVNDNSTGSGVADYPAMLTKGIRGILEEVEAAYRALPKHATNWTKIEFYRACKIALNAVIAYAHRYADLAEETAKAETNPKKQAELMEIAEVCRRVPEFPARNFREALQSFWFTHCCIQIEQCGCGHSLGRYGQYMYPFYKKDLDEGTLTKEQVLTLLKCQWVKHLEIAVYQGDAYAKAFSGHTGQTISLGGYTADGDDASNDLEELLMDTQIAMNNIQPTLALFYTPKMKPSYLEKAAEVVRSGSGQPQFMNMNAAVARSMVRFASRGITLDEARTLPVIFGCVGTGIQGKGSYVTFEGQPNLAKLVEFAMYDGYDPHTRKQVFPNVKPAEECATFEELYDALLRHMDHAYDAQRKISDLGNSTREQIVPNIFRSCLLDGCIESGLCEEAGGPKYSQSLCITSTGIDAANSLYAIKHLIYDTKQLTWEQLKKALAANFEGYEDIQKLCFGAPKHGNDIEDVDQLTRRFFRDVERIYRSHGPDYFGYEAHMDPFSLSYHNYFAPMTGALPNGRQKGVALTDASVSAMPGTDVNGSTALIKSAAQAIDTVRNNCNHMNMKFLPSALEGPSGTRMLLNLIKTYFDLGGGHIQFNCVSSETLCDAQEHPQNYKNLASPGSPPTSPACTRVCRTKSSSVRNTRTSDSYPDGGEPPDCRRPLPNCSTRMKCMLEITIAPEVIAKFKELLVEEDNEDAVFRIRETKVGGG